MTEMRVIVYHAALHIDAFAAAPPSGCSPETKVI